MSKLHRKLPTIIIFSFSLITEMHIVETNTPRYLIVADHISTKSYQLF